MNHPQDLYHEVQLGGDIKSFLLALHRRNTGELPVLSPKTDKLEAVVSVDELPIVTTSTVSTFSIASIIPHRFYTENGYQVLKLDHLTVGTIDLVSEAVRRFRRATGRYPDEIVPCPSRYILLKFGHFCPCIGVLIPFSNDFAFPIDYDVVVRRRMHG